MRLTGIVGSRVRFTRGSCDTNSGRDDHPTNNVSTMIERITIETPDQGLFEITDRIDALVEDADLDEGLCTLFLQHTSASLLIQENAANAARRDLEDFFMDLVPEDNSLYTHSEEGPDDMPAHIKAALTQTSLQIPITDGELALGTWQGIFLFEHRWDGRRRNLVVHLGE